MTSRIARRAALALTLAAAFSAPSLAANLSWDTTPGGIGPGDSLITGGTGAWDLTNGNWTIDGGANNIGWVNANNDTAVFGDTAGTVTLGVPSTAGGLTFNTTGYTVTGSTLTLGGATPTVSVGSGMSATISSILAGTTGLTKSDTGTLILSNNTNTFTGGVVVSAGTLQIGTGASNTGNLVAGNGITVVSSAVLEFKNNNVAGATAITNVFNAASTGTLRLTGANDGLGNGLSNTIGAYSLGTGNTALTNGFTIAANSSRVSIGATTNVGGATLVNENNGQLFFSVAGPFANNMTIQGVGWGEAAGNLGAIRLTGTTLTGTITLANNSRITTHSTTASTISGIVAESGGARTLEIGGSTAASNITLSGANTYTGGTIINGTNGVSGSLNAFTTLLTLNYATQDNNKLGDAGILKFKGTSTLTMAGGTHAELVGSTTLDAGATASITRSSGAVTLNLGALTRNTAATLNVGTASIASTSSGTTGEAFGSWFTLGIDLASKDGSNNIVIATYTDVPTATGTIVDSAASSVRLSNAVAGSVALNGSPGDTLTINTLSRQVAGLATIDTAGKTLRIRNGVLSNSASGGITLGTAANSGTLTAGAVIDTAGTLDFNTLVGNVTVNATVTNNGAGMVSLTKLGAAELILSGTNTYTGGTTLSGGTIRLVNDSALGSGSVTVLTSSSIGTIAGGPSTITLGNNIAINNTATLSLLIGNANFTVNSVFSGVGGALTVNAGGSPNNSATFTTAQTYTGATTVSAGKLLLGNGGNLATTPMTVANTAFFGVSQNANATSNTTAGAITLSAGGGITMADGFTSTLNAGSTVAFTGGAGSTLSFDLGGTSTAADRLAITGAASGTGGTAITINGIGSTAPTTGPYTIITAASGLNTANFTLAKTKTVVNGTAYGLTLTNTATTTVVNVTGVSGLDAAYWTGDQDGVWNVNNSGNTNWATAANGVTEAGATPNSVTDVFFSATGATNLTTALGADTTIYSLNYTATSSATTLGTENTLTIGSAGSSGSSPGINVASGSAAQTINAPVTLGAAQSWTNSGTNSLTIGGAVTNSGFGLTIAGSGPITVSGAIAGTGATIVSSSGTVVLSGPISGNGPISATGTGNTTISGNITGTSSLTKSGTGTLTVSGTNAYTGSTTLGAGTLRVASSAGLGASGQGITISGGTLQLGSDTAVTSKNVTLSGNMIAVLDRETTGAGLTTTFGNLSALTTGRTITVSNGSNVTSGTSTLAFGGTLSLSGVTTTFDIGTGAAVNLSGSTAGGAQTITLTKNGVGTLIFSGNGGTWDGGAVTVSAGTLELRTRMGDNTQFSAPITAAAGTTVRLANDTGTQFISNLMLSGNMQVVADRLNSAATSTTHSLGNLSIGAQTLTISRGSNITGAGIGGVTFNEIINSGTGTTTLTGNATFNTEANTLLTIKGVTSGAFSLTKTGLGSVTLSAANTYSGGTVVNGGTLTLGFGGVSSNILSSAGTLTLGGGTLNLTGTGTQTVGGLTTSLATSSIIVLAANETLNLGALTSAGAGSTLNINTSAGGANATTPALGTGIVTLTGQTPGSSINIGYTVTDAGGTGLATVNASNQVIRMSAAISTLLPASAADAAIDYLIDNNAGDATVAGSSSLAVTTSQSTRTISVDTTTAAGILTLNSGAVLSNNGWLFSGTGSNTYRITGAGTLTSVAAGNPITFNNMNTGIVTIESAIVANGTNAVGFTGPGTTILTATNTYTGATGIASGVVQVGVGAVLDGLATTGALPATTVTIASGAKLIYNRAGQTNALAGGGAVEYYGNNNGTTGGVNVNVSLNNASTAFTGTMLVSGIRAQVDNAGDLGTSQVTVLNNGQIYATAVTLPSNFIISGTGWGETAGIFGALRLDGTTINGTITLAGDSRIGTANATGIINGVIGETGGARKFQVGGGNTATYSTTLTLNAANTYTGGTDIGSSTSTANSVNVGNNLAFGTGTINVLSAGTVTSSGAARTLANPFAIATGKTLTLNGAGGLLTLNGGVSGAGALAVSGGTVLLSGTNNYTGATTVSAGTLQISGSINPGAGNLTLGSTSAGTLTVLNGGSFTTTGTVNLGSGIIGNVLNINAGGSLSTTTLNNAWQTTYNVDGTLTASGAWTISTNATSNINGVAAGSISAASLTTGNSGTIVNFNSLGMTNITGNLSLAATATGVVNLNAGTVNLGGVTWGGAAQTLNLVGGRLNIGAAGIAATGGTSRGVNLGNAVVGARANWSSAQAMSLTGTGSGTTLNTLDSVDGTTARTISLSGLIGGSGKLVKDGAGTLNLSNTNTYTGTTTVSAGILQVASTGTINTSSGVSINGGELNYNSATALTAPITFTAGKISGTGTINTGVTSGTDTTLSPGNSPGIQPYGAGLALTNGGTYTWEVNSWTGTPVAGTDFDQIQVTAGGLNISGLTAGAFPANTYKIDINGLTAGNAIGAVSGFDNTLTRSWTILTSNALTGTFNSNLFTIDTTNFTGANSLGGGSFSLSNTGSNLILNFNPATAAGPDLAVTTVATPDLFVLQNASLATATSLVTLTNGNGNTGTLSGFTPSNAVLTATTGQSIPPTPGTVNSTISLLSTGTNTTAIGATVTYLTTATDSNAADNVATVNVRIGNAPLHATASSTTFGAALIAATPISVTPYTNLSSNTIGQTSTGSTVPALGTTATIYNYTNSTGTDTGVSMAWRSRTAAEASSTVPGDDGTLVAGYLVSDVVNLTGMGNAGGTGFTDTFILQMSYNEALLDGFESFGVTEGNIVIAWKDGSNWVNAVNGNSTPGGTYFANQAYNAASRSLGDYGIDPTNNVVWAVLNHNSEFAVIPEPSTLVLGGLALLGFAGAGLRRRRMSKQG
jgi:fibronectin-binding autotransporter adhesin